MKIAASVLNAWRAWSRQPGSRRIVTLAALAALLFGPDAYQWARLSWTQWRLDRQLSSLTAEKDRLTKARARLQSDPTYVEGLIRSTFKVSQPGEYVVPLNTTPPKDKSR